MHSIPNTSAVPLGLYIRYTCEAEATTPDNVIQTPNVFKLLTSFLLLVFLHGLIS